MNYDNTNVEETRKIKTFETLDCWKASTEVRKFILELVKTFPSNEQDLLVAAMKKSSRGATDSIAEGYGRFHYQENIQFCRQARGFLYQLLNQLVTAKDEAFLVEDDYNTGRELTEQALTLLNGYINYLIKAKKQRDNEKHYTSAN